MATETEKTERKPSATAESISKFTSKITSKLKTENAIKTEQFKKLGDRAAINQARFIWQNRWRLKCIQLRNPLILSNILMRALNSNSYFIDGANMDEYSLYVDNASECLLDSAERIDKITTKTGVAKLASGGTGLVAAGIGVTGLVLAPPTGGLSL